MYRSWQAFPGCVWSGRNFKREQNLGCKAAHMVCLRGEEALGHPFNRYGKPRLCYLHLLQRLCHLVPVPKEFFFTLLYSSLAHTHGPLSFLVTGKGSWYSSTEKKFIQTKRYTILRPSTRDNREEFFRVIGSVGKGRMWALDDKTRKWSFLKYRLRHLHRLRDSTSFWVYFPNYSPII